MEGKDLFNRTQCLTAKEKINNPDFIKIRNVCSLADIIKRKDIRKAYI